MEKILNKLLKKGDKKTDKSDPIIELESLEKSDSDPVINLEDLEKKDIVKSSGKDYWASKEKERKDKEGEVRMFFEEKRKEYAENQKVLKLIDSAEEVLRISENREENFKIKGMEKLKEGTLFDFLNLVKVFPETQRHLGMGIFSMRNFFEGVLLVRNLDGLERLAKNIDKFAEMTEADNSIETAKYYNDDFRTNVLIKFLDKKKEVFIEDIKELSGEEQKVVIVDFLDNIFSLNETRKRRLEEDLKTKNRPLKVLNDSFHFLAENSYSKDPEKIREKVFGVYSRDEYEEFRKKYLPEGNPDFLDNFDINSSSSFRVRDGAVLTNLYYGVDDIVGAKIHHYELSPDDHDRKVFNFLGGMEYKEWDKDERYFKDTPEHNLGQPLGELEKLIPEIFRGEKEILNLGGGMRDYGIADVVENVINIDLSEHVKKENGSEKTDGKMLIQGDAEKLPIREEGCDGVVAIELVFYTNFGKICQEAFRVLKSGKKFVVGHFGNAGFLELSSLYWIDSFDIIELEEKVLPVIKIKDGEKAQDLLLQELKSTGFLKIETKEIKLKNSEKPYYVVVATK